MPPAKVTWLAPVSRPTLVLRQDRARRNIRRMSRRLADAGVALRPHFKTHQSATIGQWFRDEGVTRITTSSVDMARYFADEGWRDITLAFPTNLRQLDELNRLAARVTLGLVADDDTVVHALSDALTSTVRLWIKVDAGYGRAGLPWQQTKAVTRLAGIVAGLPELTFAGLLAHAGHSYHARTTAEILRIHDETVERMTGLRHALQTQGQSCPTLSIGDTPCCSLATSFDGIDEVRPGNYVFYDLTQARLGACRDEDIAVAVACPVVGAYPDQRKVVLYGGAVHLSKEVLEDDTHGGVYGYLAHPTEHGWDPPDRRCPIVSLSQEHAVVAVAPDAPFHWRPGDIAMVLPVHSCLTADLHSSYLTPGQDAISRVS